MLKAKDVKTNARDLVLDGVSMKSDIRTMDRDRTFGRCKARVVDMPLLNRGFDLGTLTEAPRRAPWRRDHDRYDVQDGG